MIASGFHRVDHKDIVEYLPLGRRDEVDLSFSSTVRAQPGPLSMFTSSEEGVSNSNSNLYFLKT